jgi:uncharacterized protein (DUF1501 family)
MSNSRYSRRDFLNGAACMVAAGGVSSFVPKLNMIGNALAQSNTSGYKAMVCVYLNGGSDSWNMLIPTGTQGSGAQYSHADYVTSRSGLYNVNPGALGIPRVTTPNALPPAVALTNTSGNLGVNPFATELAELYNSGELSFIANIGTLVEPLTKATYNARRKPPQLYSHNDQTNLWQIGGGNSSTNPTGFGGMIAGITAQPNLVNLSSAISIAGSNRFLVGKTLTDQPVFPFQLSNSGTQPAPVLSNYNENSTAPGEPQRRQALLELFNLAYPDHFSAEYKDIFNRSLTLADVINTQIVNNGTLTTTFENNNIANQLKQIARMIKVSRATVNGQAGAIQANRQVFFASVGGYDTHDNQITSTNQANGHHGLLSSLAKAVKAFNAAMVEIGANNEVVLFSISDFARTWNPNNNGTDHAWGSVQFASGGPVNGGQIFGRYPRIQLNNSGDANGENFSRGQTLPTTAVDQMAASIARWMGVDNSNLPLVFPNIDRFATGPFANAAASPTFAYFNRVIPNLMQGIS